MAKKKAAKKQAASKKSAKKKAGPKNSLVANINRRKKAGKSRSKQDSTVSDESYANMKQGWPKSKRKKKKAKS